MSFRKFKFLFAFRNISANKKSSLVVVITLSLVFALLILLFGIYSTFFRIYELRAENEYQNTDIIVSYDEYSVARLINKRYLENDYGDYTNYILSFFNLDVLSETSDNEFYAKMITSTPDEIELLLGINMNVKDNEVVITKTLADKFNVKIGDNFDFNILSKKFTYSVGKIVADKGIFKNYSFYVNKASIFDKLYGLPMLMNLGNTVYIDVDDSYEIDDIIQLIKADNNYSGYHIFPSVDKLYINNLSMDQSSIIIPLGIIVIIAMFMVLDSLFPVINANMKQTLGIINSLGGENKIVYQVNLLQWGIYVFISFILGIIFSYAIINFGIHTIGLKGYAGINMMSIILSLIIITVYIFLRSLLAYKKELKSSIVELSKNKKYDIYHLRYISIIIITILLILEFILVPFSLPIHSLIITLLSVYLALEFSSVLLIGLGKLLMKFHFKSFFRIFQLKYLIHNKHIHQSLKVLLISLISLIMIFAIRGFLDSEINKFYSMMKYDLLVTNISDYSDNLLNDINSDDVNDIEKGIIYRDLTLYMNNKNDFQTINIFISLKQDKLSNYFDLKILDFDSDCVNSETPVIFLPKNFKIIYGLKTGDFVSMNLNYLLTDVNFKIAGFLDTNFDNIVYSNIFEIAQYQDLAKINTIFINTDNVDGVYHHLIQEYSSRMYYILNSNIYFNSIIKKFESIVDFFTVLTSFLILSFIIIIFNNTLLVFYDMKNYLAKLKVLGVDKRIFITSLLKEFLLISFVISIVGMIETVILSKYLKNVILIFKYYKDVSSSLQIDLLGLFLTFIILLFSYIFYLNKINKIEIVEEIKIY